MPSEADIIKLLRQLRANDPIKYEEYTNYYKNKYPDFYKERIVPEVEQRIERGESVKKQGAPINPAEHLQEEIKPIGSANVGEELESKAEAGSVEKEETVNLKKQAVQANGNKESSIKRAPNKMRNILIGLAVGIVVIGLISVIYFVFLKP